MAQPVIRINSERLKALAAEVNATLAAVRELEAQPIGDVEYDAFLDGCNAAYGAECFPTCPLH